jgi:steroid 5-alpha reductase family enzyme
MRRDTPIHTFWSIICMTFAALVVVHTLEIPGERAMPIFVLFMLLGVPLGEFLERRANRKKA